MMSHVDFSPAAVFKMADTMCELGNSTVAKALKTEVQVEEAVESQEDIVQGLLSAATHVKTMLSRPIIEGSSITLGVVVVDNFQGFFNLLVSKKEGIYALTSVIGLGSLTIDVGSIYYQKIGAHGGHFEEVSMDH
jgi:hypothetical protein